MSRNVLVCDVSGTQELILCKKINNQILNINVYNYKTNKNTNLKKSNPLQTSNSTITIFVLLVLSEVPLNLAFISVTNVPSILLNRCLGCNANKDTKSCSFYICPLSPAVREA